MTLSNSFISFPFWVRLLWGRNSPSRAQGFLRSLMSWHTKIGCLCEMRSQINRHAGYSCRARGSGSWSGSFRRRRLRIVEFIRTIIIGLLKVICHGRSESFSPRGTPTKMRHHHQKVRDLEHQLIIADVPNHDYTCSATLRPVSCARSHRLLLKSQ